MRAAAALTTTVFILALAGAGAASAGSAGQSVRLVVGYCPTDFTGKGAIVNVEPATAKWSVVTTFDLPSEVFGCVADYSPLFDVVRSDEDTIWLDFTEDLGFFLAVDTKRGNTTHFSSSSWFFTGFENFKYSSQANALRGVTMTVTESGFCSDGCAAFGNQHLPASGSKKFEQLALIPFKAVADDTSFYNEPKGEFSFQASYDLRPVTCGPASDSECLITVSTADGSLLSAIYNPSYYVYRFARYPVSPKSQEVLSFVIGFNEQCNNTNGSYAFARVVPKTAAVSLVACADSSLVVQEGPWVAAFSHDQTLFSTSSGNGDGDNTQFVTLNTTSGAIVVNRPLHGLAQALKAKMGLVFVWALEYYGSEHPTGRRA